VSNHDLRGDFQIIVASGLLALRRLAGSAVGGQPLV
jgi:hypothetical protein